MAESARTILSAIHIFAGLEEEAMDFLGRAAQKRHAEVNEIIVRQDAVGSEMFVIAAGETEVIKNLGTPRQITLATMGPGEFFGEMCIFDCMPRAATVRASLQGELYSLRNIDLLSLFQRWPEQYGILMLNISRDLCRRLRATQDLLCAVRQNGMTAPDGSGWHVAAHRITREKFVFGAI